MTAKLYVAALYVRIPLDEVDLKTWTPSDPNDVDVGLIIKIGCEGEEWTTLFRARVATPDALKKSKVRPRTTSIVSTRALIVVSRYDRDELQREIQNTVEWASRKDSRDEALAYLTRYFGWEFEETQTVR